MAIPFPKFRRPAAQANVQEKKPPHILEMKGIFMLLLAVLYDLVNVFLGILDLLAIGLILSPIWNGFALATLGAWLYFETGRGVRSPDMQKNKRLIRFLMKRVALPFIGNSIPIAKFFPWWLWSVWGSLDKSFAPQETPSQPATEGTS